MSGRGQNNGCRKKVQYRGAFIELAGIEAKRRQQGGQDDCICYNTGFNRAIMTTVAGDSMQPMLPWFSKG